MADASSDQDDPLPEPNWIIGSGRSVDRRNVDPTLGSPSPGEILVVDLNGVGWTYEDIINQAG